MQNTNTPGLFGNTQTNTNQQGPGQQSVLPPQQGQPGQQGQQGSQFGSQQNQFGAQQNPQRGFQAGGLQQTQNSGSANPAFGAQPNQATQFGQQTQLGQQRGFQPGGQQGQFSAGGSSIGTPVGSGGIIGVASDSDKDSIKVYNTRQKYNEWEFLAILGQRGQQGQPPNGQPHQPGVPPNQAPAQSPFSNAPLNPFGGQPSGSPNRGAGSPLNPFGGQPAGSPLNPGVGQSQTQTPFGFGGTPQMPQPQRGR